MREKTCWEKLRAKKKPGRRVEGIEKGKGGNEKSPPEIAGVRLKEEKTQGKKRKKSKKHG